VTETVFFFKSVSAQLYIRLQTLRRLTWLMQEARGWSTYHITFPSVGVSSWSHFCICFFTMSLFSRCKGKVLILQGTYQCLLCCFWTQNRSCFSLTAPACKISRLKDACMHLECIFWSYNMSTFNDIHFDKTLFTCRCKKRKQKGVRVSNMVLLLGIFKQHHGSEVVNY